MVNKKKNTKMKLYYMFQKGVDYEGFYYTGLTAREVKKNNHCEYTGECDYIDICVRRVKTAIPQKYLDTFSESNAALLFAVFDKFYWYDPDKDVYGKCPICKEIVDFDINDDEEYVSCPRCGKLTEEMF